MNLRTRVGVLLLVGLLGAAVVPNLAFGQDTPQDPTPNCVDDPDEAGVGARGEIYRYCAIWTDADEIAFIFDVQQAVDPNTDQGWREGTTSIRGSVYLSGDQGGFPSYTLLAEVEGTGIVAQIEVLNASTGGCDATFTYSPTRYTIGGIAPACLGNPASFESDAVLQYDGGDVTPDLTGTDLTFPVSTQRGGQVPSPDSVTIPPPAGGETPAPPPRPAGYEVPALRLAGPGRIETAVEISRYQFPDGARDVYLARADAFPDALAAGALTKGPVLLVPQCGGLPQVLRDELERLQPFGVIALGGESAVCDQVLQDARDAAQGPG